MTVKGSTKQSAENDRDKWRQNDELRTMLTLLALPNSADAHFSGRVDIAKARFTIGRGTENDWVISDPKRMVSKRHCIIEQTPQGYRVVDSSTNGVTVNGAPVDRNNGVMLRNNDEIECGQYRFRVEMAGGPGLALEQPGAPKITAILQDVAAGGATAGGALPRIEADFASGQAQAPRKRVIDDLGWDGPPTQEVDVVKPADILAPTDREFMNRMEQTPTDRLRIDLPKPQKLLPDDWNLDSTDPEESSAPATPQQSIPPAAGASYIPPEDFGQPAQTIAPQPSRTSDPRIIPVENIDLDIPPRASPTTPPQTAFAEPAASPQPYQQPPTIAPQPVHRLPQAAYQPPVRETALLDAFCEGAGVNAAELQAADPETLFRNLGRAFAIAAAGLQELQMGRMKTAAVLDTGENRAATPWIFSVSGEDRSNVVRAVTAYLADATPGDIEAMRADFTDIRVAQENLAESVLAFIDKVQRGLSLQAIERNAGSGLIPAMRRAAMWDAFVENSGLFADQNGKKTNVDLVKLLIKEMQKRR